MNDEIDTEQLPSEGSLADGIRVIAEFVHTLPRKPGVYRMISADGEVLYVGKARSLRSRVAAYTQPTRLATRLIRMVSATRTMEFAVTDSEAEALLLENNLIKRFRPRFNVLLRDDKSFPYIVIRRDTEWPQLAKHRGNRDPANEYFGPFASATAVNRTLYALQRAFPLRSCSDGVFSTRTRPCLQYQIKRCTAPCVGRIGKTDYDAIVDEVRDFLGGKNREVQQALSQRMEQASANLEFEQAAVLRDRIKALAHIQSHQSISLHSIDEADIFAAHAEGGQVCVQVFFLRAGQNLGNRAYFPSHARELDEAAVLSAFIGQFYESRSAPKLVLTSHEVAEAELLQSALSLSAGHKVEIRNPKRGDQKDALDQAVTNAREALARRMAERGTQRQLLEGVARVFGLDAPPERIEVYDNSHIQGAAPIGAMIVAGADGFIKNSYRKFNIKSEGAAGDDFAMMREVMSRRFGRALKENPERDEEHWPDLVLIDGGQGQLEVTRQVLTELGLEDIAIVGIAKGPDRDAGRERFFVPGRPPFSLEHRDPVLYFLQRLRDEAHRFAIGTHRTRRAADITRSALDEVPGIGAGRKRALLHHFGSARAVAVATLEDIKSVPGISDALARKIHDHFRGSH
ncbi:Excinuclease ABC subunit C [Enhydrobacter aerosaccus]|uniref:UvrABC system protein C n=1 Tax=Enhydrobacter aerosaccus TaxID=225324 RepID=A0A1T4P9G6_9HYPH|nr:excinuclease ABC subunit UvrC [Enhydrobacter aerosaccus]SJZ87518.1 Excinuclease ABC subunit C [Enhydrobacter aerosaccus]